MTREITTIDGWAVKYGKAGAVFYSDKRDKDITAISAYYQRPLTTERVIVTSMDGYECKSKYITKVTLL